MRRQRSLNVHDGRALVDDTKPTYFKTNVDREKCLEWHTSRPLWLGISVPYALDIPCAKNLKPVRKKASHKRPEMHKNWTNKKTQYEVKTRYSLTPSWPDPIYRELWRRGARYCRGLPQPWLYAPKKTPGISFASVAELRIPPNTKKAPPVYCLYAKSDTQKEEKAALKSCIRNHPHVNMSKMQTSKSSMAM